MSVVVEGLIVRPPKEKTGFKGACGNNCWGEEETRGEKNDLKWQKPSLRKNLMFFRINFDFVSLVHVPSSNMDEAWFMTYTAASHQGAIKMIWVPFCRAFMASIFINSLWVKYSELYKTKNGEKTYLCINWLIWDPGNQSVKWIKYIVHETLHDLKHQTPNTLTADMWQRLDIFSYQRYEAAALTPPAALIPFPFIPIMLNQLRHLNAFPELISLSSCQYLNWIKQNERPGKAEWRQRKTIKWDVMGWEGRERCVRGVRWGGTRSVDWMML